jgi:hypothetical protein
VPCEGAIEAWLVDVRRPAAGAVWPGAGAVGGHVGERVWVVNGKDHGDVGSLNTVDNEVGELEGVAGKLLALDVELSGSWESEGAGEGEGDACGEEADELHGGGSLVVFVE